MDLKLFVLLVFGITVVVVGILQWLKGLWKTVPSWLPAALLPILTLALGWVVAPVVTAVLGLRLLMGGLSWALGQLCYEIIVQSIPALVQGAIDKAEGKTPAPDAPVAPVQSPVGVTPPGAP
jgi:hypothetical protein